MLAAKYEPRRALQWFIPLLNSNAGPCNQSTDLAPKYSSLLVLNWWHCPCPWSYIWLYLKISFIVATGQLLLKYKWGESRDAAKHPMVHRTAPTAKNYPASNIKPWLRTIVISLGKEGSLSIPTPIKCGVSWWFQNSFNKIQVYSYHK